MREVMLRFRGVTHALHERVRRQAPVDLSFQDLHLMKALMEGGPQTQGRLADVLALSKGAISQAVTRLEGEDLVERQRDANDGRVQWVHLTAKAERMRDHVEAHMSALFADLFQDWSDDDARRIIRLLDDMIVRAR